jgi:hypothetical protein
MIDLIKAKERILLIKPKYGEFMKKPGNDPFNR